MVFPNSLDPELSGLDRLNLDASPTAKSSQASEKVLPADGHVPMDARPDSRRKTAPLWQHLVRAGSASRKTDVWANMTADVPTELALDHTYDLESNTWSARPVLVKLDTSEPVAHGAMRACFRMKMLHSTGKSRVRTCLLDCIKHLRLAS
jgi:hypothetical protein